MDSNMPEGVPTEAGKVEKLTPRSIRFYDPEWERFEAFSDRCGLAAAEFARFAAIGGGSGASPGSRSARPAGPADRDDLPRHVYAGDKMRDEMLAAGRGEELDAPIAAAHGLQEEVLSRRFGLKAHGWAAIVRLGAANAAARAVHSQPRGFEISLLFPRPWRTQ